MNMHSKSAFILASVLLTSCATSPKPNEVNLRVESIPKGALIYSENKAIGESPVYIKYTVTEQMIRSGFVVDDVYAVWPGGAKFVVANVHAVWPSGAKATERVKINLGRSDQKIVISRPVDAPGLEIDLGRINSDNNDGGYINPLWNNFLQTPTYTSCIRNGMLTQCTTR